MDVLWTWLLIVLWLLLPVRVLIVIADMRHHLVHGYYQVDSTIIWAVVQNDLSPLREQIEKYLTETNWTEWEQK